MPYNTWIEILVVWKYHWTHRQKILKNCFWHMAGLQELVFLKHYLIIEISEKWTFLNISEAFNVLKNKLQVNQFWILKVTNVKYTMIKIKTSNNCWITINMTNLLINWWSFFKNILMLIKHPIKLITLQHNNVPIMLARTVWSAK